MPSRKSTTPKSSRPTRTPKSASTTPRAAASASSRRTPAKRAPASASTTPKSSARTTSKVVYVDPSTTEEEESSEDSEADAFDPGDDDEEELAKDDDDLPEDEDEEDEIDSDDLDDEKPKRGKRKSDSGGGGSARKKAKTGANGSGAAAKDEDEDEDDHSDVSLESGQEIAGRIYPAPKTGHVPPGRISNNTISFLTHLLDPKKNDRDWFRAHEPSFRLAEKEWQAFVGKMVGVLRGVDGELPALPPKDLIHRIYRDVRFSNDKTPYKPHLAASISRSGRKGIWAGYHLQVSGGGKSLMAAGVWAPGKDELASIRHQILTNPSVLKSTISAPEFTALFGAPNPPKAAKGKGQHKNRQNIFGHDDALKVAPKGVDRDHKDIELLKLRSVAVVHRFTDEEVISPGFMDKIEEMASAMRPLVHCLNNYMSIPAPAT